MYTSVTDVFKYPCNSTKIGIMKLGGLCKNKKVVLIDDIEKKNVFFLKTAIRVMQLHYFIIHNVITIILFLYLIIVSYSKYSYNYTFNV